MMNADVERDATGPAQIINGFRRRGVQLWVDDGKLRYKAPRGVINPSDLEILKQHRHRLVQWLESAQASSFGGERVVGSQPLASAPLTHTQRVRWRSYGSERLVGHRWVARALHLHGLLDIDALQRTLEILVARHDALRVRFAINDTEPVQIDGCSTTVALTFHDLTALTGATQDEDVTKIIHQLITEPVSLLDGPLFGAVLIRTAPESHQLIIAMEHLISDGASMDVLLRELFVIYEAQVSHEEHSLPPVPIRFLDYASQQRKTHETWISQHGQYWGDRSRGYRRVEFPHRKHLEVTGLGSVPITFSAWMKNELRQWSRNHRSTVAMTVLTAYAALVLRWCQVTDIVLRCQSDGREDPSLENVVGFLASTLHLRIESRAEDTLLDLRDRISHEYYNARLHFDSSWIEAQIPRLDFNSGPSFNWIPQTAAGSLTRRTEAATSLEIVELRFAHPLVGGAPVSDHEPSVQFWESAVDIIGDVYFPRCCYDRADMERFAYNLITVVETLLRSPATRVRDISIH